MHHVVIGAGVFGAWTAWHLQAAGARVTLVDAYGVGNSRSSSGDESRILRCGYGTDRLYSSLAARSRPMWQALSNRLGERQPPLWHGCGVLWLGSGDDPYIATSRSELMRGGYEVEVLDAATLRTRYPHLASDDVRVALLEPGGGVVMARRAVQALVDELVAAGVTYRRAHVMPAASGKGALRTLRFSDGSALTGDVFVFACGAWLPRVLPVLAARIRPTRQAVIYFGTPPGDDRFGSSGTPAWVDFAAGIYGVPCLEARGLKVGIDTHGPSFDPDVGDRTIDDASVAAARAWLQRRFPAMADAPLVEARVCQYENTSTGDFLIDRHPDHDNVWIVGGGSGHGFKHGPAVGEYAARLIAGTIAPEPRFALATKDVVGRRSIY